MKTWDSYLMGKVLGLALMAFACGAIPTEGWNMKEFKKPGKEELKKRLTPIQYEVTQQEGTERPFSNEYWNEKREGIYVDVVSGEPLFSSKDKYDSKTGWPSFTRPLVAENLVEHQDRKLFAVRTEIRSRLAQSHLGHVFDDGPAPTGLRYCMNSAALRFIPKQNLAQEGYAEFESQFGKQDARSAVAKAVFAGGCFWCMEPPFDALVEKGVIETRVGYTGGRGINPSYEEVSGGGTGHREAIEITYDPARIGFEQLLSVFWMNVDPLDGVGQFCDKGHQYTSAIFYAAEEQKKMSLKSLDSIKSKIREKGKIATEILPAGTFYSAEEYHQDYYLKNPLRYKFYRFNCGRDQRLKAVWGS